MKRIFLFLMMLLPILAVGQTEYKPSKHVDIGAGVISLNSRDGVVVPVSSDYSFSMLGGFLSSVQAQNLRDTTVKGYVFSNVAAADSGILFESRESGITICEIRAIRTGGTSASVNATKNGSTDLLTANYATSTSMASAGTLQNNTLAIGDLIRVAVRAISGTAQEIFIQITYCKVQL